MRKSKEEFCAIQELLSGQGMPFISDEKLEIFRN